MIPYLIECTLKSHIHFYRLKKCQLNKPYVDISIGNLSSILDSLVERQSLKSIAPENIEFSILFLKCIFSFYT